MALPVRKGYKGNGVQTQVTGSAVLVAATSFSVAAITGWPTTFPFYIVVDPGTSKEEKMSVTGISTLTLTVVRAQDDTLAAEHAVGAVAYPVFTADEADEANMVASAMTTKGDIIATDGTTINRLAVGTNTHVLQADSAATNGFKWGQVATANIADNAVTQAKLSASLSGITVTTSALLATAVPSPFNGQVIYETDTRYTRVYDSSAWRVINFAGQYKVGDTGPGGGTIFFVDRYDEYAGFTYLELAPSSTQVLRTWAQSTPTNYQSTLVSGADSWGLGTGTQNTLDIIAQGNSTASTCAAKYCDDLVSGGQSDWYLPSMGELFLASNTLKVKFNDSTLNGYFWSSTESSASESFFLVGATATTSGTAKSSSLETRAVRKF